MSCGGPGALYAVGVVMARAREARTSLPPELASASAARRFVGSTLRDWSCDTLSDSALLLVSELVTNAVLHARSRLDLVLQLRDERLRVEVHDGSQAQPTRKYYSPHAGTGRGLMLVEQLAAEWGVEPIAGDGKRVWFELDRDGRDRDIVGDEVDLDAIERMLLGVEGGEVDVEGAGGGPDGAAGPGGAGPQALLVLASV
jgi:anti-sigma regulatory factor (Ser/Thr protein kinase)